MHIFRPLIFTISFLPIAILGLSGCSSNVSQDEADGELGEQSDSESQLAEVAIDPFFQQFIGSWVSPCLLEPTRLIGPSTGDYVVYKLSFSNRQTILAHQDYLDDECVEEWTHGNGSVAIDFVFSTRSTSESGLDVAVFPRSIGTTIFGGITGDPTPGDNSSGGAGSSSQSSSAIVIDIIHRSENGELYLGDLNSAADSDTAPTRLDFNSRWTSFIDPQ